MIEVMISAMLVAVLVLGTFSAFDAAGRTSADERAHAQATVLAQQDEERMRGMTIAELGQLGTKTRSVTEGATTFTITSSAQYVASESEEFTCSTSSGTADYLQTTSKVTWPALGQRAPVTQSSIVAGPASAGLKVKVLEAKGKPLEGAEVTVSGASTQTTPESGCVVFGGLPAGTYTVTASDGEYIDTRGRKPSSAEVELTGTSLATHEFQLSPPGEILAKFENNGTSVTGDTFYAMNTEVPSPSGYVSETNGTYASSASLIGLFPFSSPAYTVFAGDCEKNNPEVIASPNPVVGGKKEVTDRTALLVPGSRTEVNVEEPAVSITVYEGTKTTPGSPVTSPTSAKMINIGCKTTNSQNYSPIEYKHNVTLSSTGTLVQKYQPYAEKLEFCVVALKSGTYYKYQTPSGGFSNTAKAGPAAMSIYLKETTTGYTKNTSKLEC